MDDDDDDELTEAAVRTLEWNREIDFFVFHSAAEHVTTSSDTGKWRRAFN